MSSLMSSIDVGTTEVTSSKYIRFDSLTREAIRESFDLLDKHGERDVYIFQWKKIKRNLTEELFWCADSCGYTRDIDRAGRYKLRKAFYMSPERNFIFLFCDAVHGDNK